MKHLNYSTRILTNPRPVLYGLNWDSEKLPDFLEWFKHFPKSLDQVDSSLNAFHLRASFGFMTWFKTMLEEFCRLILSKILHWDKKYHFNGNKFISIEFECCYFWINNVSIQDNKNKIFYNEKNSIYCLLKFVYWISNSFLPEYIFPF